MIEVIQIKEAKNIRAIFIQKRTCANYKQRWYYTENHQLIQVNSDKSGRITGYKVIRDGVFIPDLDEVFAANPVKQLSIGGETHTFTSNEEIIQFLCTSMEFKNSSKIVIE